MRPSRSAQPIRAAIAAALLLLGVARAEATTIVFTGVGDSGATLSGSAVVDQQSLVGFAPLAFSATFAGLSSPFLSPEIFLDLNDFPVVYFAVDSVSGTTFNFNARRPVDAIDVVSFTSDQLRLFGGDGVDVFRLSIALVTEDPAVEVPEPASLAVVGFGLLGLAWRRR